MAWLIGIDEAGYGPNLGPFVMTSVACRVPDPLAGASLWQVLRSIVRQRSEPDDGRLLIDDSKAVYSPVRGLLALERGVQATLGEDRRTSLHDWLQLLCSEGHAELAAETWYQGSSPVPAVACKQELADLKSRFVDACATANIGAWRARCVVVGPGRFNALLDSAGSKGAVLAHALGALLGINEADTCGTESVRVIVDKHGGRNAYAAFIQHALPRSVVLAREEGMARSTYRIHGLGRDVEIRFQPRADAEHFCVALASMASKYVRELCMLDFNRFWAERVPGLKPTAGYPTDATRFWKAIRPVVRRLGLSESEVWRRK